MIFTSIAFLIFFIILYGLLACFKQNKVRLLLLLLASYFFYGWWDYRFTLLLFSASLLAWILGAKMHQSQNKKIKKLYLTASVTISLGILAFFKYFNFFVESFYQTFGIQKSLFWDITLPVGISFYIFQVLSYNIDLYRDKIQPTKSLPKFLLFVAFFPQLVAGPIVRASEFLPQLDKKIILTGANFIIGAQLFLGGAIQKILFADTLRAYVDPVFAEPALYATSTLWLAMIAFAGQIFGDFAGYSLMAIGIARIFGFELPVNFRMPYISRSITEFWRRWHISLSFWLRDYLYISLGGNRKGIKMTYVNLLITMTLGGLWHGASWNFVIWGIMHGLLLAIHKFWLESNTSEYIRHRFGFANQLSGWAITFLCVCLLWVPFRAETSQITIDFLSGLFIPQLGIAWYHTSSIVVMLIMSIWHILYLVRPSIVGQYPTENIFTIKHLYVLMMSVIFIILYAPKEAAPFVYFQF